MHADEELLNHVRLQRDDLAEKFHRLHLENDALRREVREMTAKARERAQPKGEGIVIDGLGGRQRVFVDGFELRNVASVTNTNTPDSLSETTIVLHLPYQVRKTPPKVEGLRCPINFTKHRPDCPLSWRLTAKAERKYGPWTNLGDWLAKGWTLEQLREHGYIEPKE